MTMRKTLLAILLFLLAAPPALSGEGISVSDPWVRQSPPGASVTAAYMVIGNSAAAADELLGVSCGCASSSSLHVTEIREDSMAMKKVASIEIPPGGSAVLSPGGHHVMLEGLSGDLGESVELKLKFRSGAEISVAAPVLSPPAAKKKRDHHRHHH